MKFYHGTTKENREKIKSEGVLRGVRDAPSRCTYLAVDKEEAKQYGEIVLEVEYNPSKHCKENNYCEGCWQVRVYEPIPIENIRELQSDIYIYNLYTMNRPSPDDMKEIIMAEKRVKNKKFIKFMNIFILCLYIFLLLLVIRFIF